MFFYFSNIKRCPKLNFTSEIVKDLNTGVNFRKCQLVKRVRATHDTSLYYFNLPESSRMCVPIGHHVFVRPNESGNQSIKLAILAKID